MVVTRCQPWRWWLCVGGTDDGSDVVVGVVSMTMVRWCGDDGDDDGVEMVVVHGVMGWSEAARTAPEI
ncbi:hypothetical protein Tco_0400242 [Tanacetum coccineum]